MQIYNNRYVYYALFIIVENTLYENSKTYKETPCSDFKKRIWIYVYLCAKSTHHVLSTEKTGYKKSIKYDVIHIIEIYFRILTVAIQRWQDYR